ncbi:MAG: membrane-bound lytic murein transglycosylase B [Desulfobacteraceae bacterium Eth-SRB1]|nr:MAG: membrane-bound lytic murein transglycosylase B [Desulfobacteraceae bacterium Eth-SRB1]
MTNGKYIIFFICLLTLNLFLPGQANAGATEKAWQFKSLQKRLIKDGFDKAGINQLYNKPEVSFDTTGVTLFFKHQESRLNYDQFITWRSIRKAKKYLKTHKTALDNMERAYNVDKEIIVAIILVETRLGTCLGKRSILNTLSTMASLADPQVKKMLWSKISGSSGLTKKKFEKKAAIKSKWAYAELTALLKYAGRERMDPVALHGSYAGAMGIAQFMPSNALALAKDGDSDGRIDLFTHDDAIVSIANYLNHHGWHVGINDKKAYKILLKYNYSKYYANTILKISKLLKD